MTNFLFILLVLLIIFLLIIIIYVLSIDFPKFNPKIEEKICNKNKCKINEIEYAKYDFEATKKYRLDVIKILFTFLTITITTIGVISAYSSYIIQEKTAKNERDLKEFLSLSERITRNDTLSSVNAIVSLSKFANTEYLQDVVDIITYNLLYVSIINGNYTSKSIKNHKYREIIDNNNGLIKISELADIDTLSKISREVNSRNRELQSGQNRKKINFDNKILRGVFLVNADLEGATFDETQLQGSNLDKAILNNCQFTGSHLEYTYFCHAKLQNTTFERAYLADTNFDYADLYKADLSNSKLGNDNSFNHANLVEAKLPQDLTNNNFGYSIIDKNNFEEHKQLKKNYNFVSDYKKIQYKIKKSNYWKNDIYQNFLKDSKSNFERGITGVLIPKQ